MLFFASGCEPAGRRFSQCLVARLDAGSSSDRVSSKPEIRTSCPYVLSARLCMFRVFRGATAAWEPSGSGHPELLELLERVRTEKKCIEPFAWGSTATCHLFSFIVVHVASAFCFSFLPCHAMFHAAAIQGAFRRGQSLQSPEPLALSPGPSPRIVGTDATRK